jgi:hypothetical protein
MVFDRLFKNKGNQPITPPGLILPHPEEPIDPSATLANISVDSIMAKWLRDWGVPTQYWDHWKKAIDLKVYDIYPANLTAMGLKQDTPAGTWEAGGKRYMAVKPQWLNRGEIAHEQAHNSYALVTPVQKTAFAEIYGPLKNTYPLIRLLYSKNTYGLTNDIEGHAEVYRYIGQYMPEQLMQYYPMLFENTPAVNQPVTSQPQVQGRKAQIIPEPSAGSRTVIDQQTLPVAVSSGDVNYLCGSCGVLLIQGMVGSQPNNIVIRCPKCGAYNEI